MGGQGSEIEGSEVEMEVDYTSRDENLYVYQIEKEAHRLVYLIISDLIIHCICLAVQIQLEPIDTLMEWNGFLSGGFIIMACLDGFHLLYHMS